MFNWYYHPDYTKEMKKRILKAEKELGGKPDKLDNEIKNIIQETRKKIEKEISTFYTAFIRFKLKI